MSSSSRQESGSGFIRCFPALPLLRVLEQRTGPSQIAAGGPDVKTAVWLRRILGAAEIDIVRRRRRYLQTEFLYTVQTFSGILCFFTIRIFFQKSDIVDPEKVIIRFDSI